jgi:hypothetical protein
MAVEKIFAEDVLGKRERVEQVPVHEQLILQGAMSLMECDVDGFYCLERDCGMHIDEPAAKRM